MSGLLVAGTTSDAGKSVLTAGLCRWLSHQGVSVAPYKAQNMSNNSMACGRGVEIGRAQWLQAQAAGVVPEAAMNPVLLKPGSDRTSHVVLMGEPWGELLSGEWATGRRELAQAAFDAYDDLAARYDVVVCEGAGSPAEINLRGGDYVNMGLAREKNLPVVVVGDIDRGGVLAAMYGTWALLEPADQQQLVGWVVNKFRGDVDLLRPGLSMVEERTGLPVWGVVPWLSDIWMDGEDALTLGSWAEQSKRGTSTLSVSVVALPRLSNGTDLDAMAREPGVELSLASQPAALASADVVIVPGSRATVSDLTWMHDRGLDHALRERARRGKPVLGICGGFQMLAQRICDPHGVEAAGGGDFAGMGLLPGRIEFSPTKTVGLVRGQWQGHDVEGYEIHHGTYVADPDAAAMPFLDGLVSGSTWGTHWHGVFENDAFRQAWLAQAAQQAGSPWAPSAHTSYRGAREQMLDRVAEAWDQHVDHAQLWKALELGRP